MRRTFLALLTFMLAGAVTALADDGARLLDDAFARAMKANSPGALADLFDKDAVLFPLEGPAAKGQDAIRQHFAGVLAKYTVQDFTITDAKYYSAGTLSAGWGSWSMTAVPKAGGAPVTMSGRFSHVARATKAADGTWHWFYVLDHASPLSAAGAPAGAAAAASTP
jgi:uncharacterized protein (TIGR02246 family)